MRKYKQLVKQIILFGIVGVLTLGVDVGVTTLLFTFAHFPAWLASACGFMSGFFFNFPINRKKVFNHQPNDRFTLRVQASMVIALSLINLVLTSAIVEILVTNGIVNISYAKMAVTALIAIWNFILFRQVIFSKTKAVEA